MEMPKYDAGLHAAADLHEQPVSTNQSVSLLRLMTDSSEFLISLLSGRQI